MIKQGALLQWKKDNQKWGFFYKEPPPAVYHHDNVFEWFKLKKRICEEYSDEDEKCQYLLLVIEKLSHKYKIGNVLLKEKIYWKCMLTHHTGKIEYIWVEDNEVEPYEEGSYDIKNILLRKHLMRIQNKKQ